MSVLLEHLVTDPKLSITTLSPSEIQISFPTPPSLLTHIAFIVKDSQIANRTFKLHTIESKTKENSDFSSMQNFDTQANDTLQFTSQGTAVLVPSLGLSHSIKLVFECEKSEFEDYDQQVAAISYRNHWQILLFQETYSSIAIVGFSLYASPTASHVVTLLNAASYLRTHQQGSDADYLAGLALMNARRFVQASEFIRRSESRLVSSLSMPLNASTPRTNTQRTPTATNNPKLLRAAKLELLVAEGFNQHGQILDKLIAYERAVELYLCGSSLGAVTLDSDVYSSLLRLQPHLGRLLLRNLQDKLEPLRIACIRGLQFLLQHLGCSLATQFSLLLKAVIESYPSQLSLHPDSINVSMISNNSFIDIMQIQQPSTMLVDAYNRLIQTSLNTLSSCSPGLLHQIFNEVLSHHILLPQLSDELKVYLLRLIEKITLICEGDLDYSGNLLSRVLALRLNQMTSDQASRLWQVIKLKVLVYYTGRRLESLVQWMKELLTEESGRDNVDCVFELLQTLVQKESQSCLIRPRQRAELSLLIPVLIQWVDYAASSQKEIYLFQQVWDTIVCVSSQLPELSLLQIIYPLLEKTLKFCSEYTPSVNMLKFLQIVLQTIKPDQRFCQFLLDFLPVFSRCVPSNINDQVFSVLNLILGVVGDYLEDYHLQKIVLALLDQYTVKSKSQRQSRNFLTSLIITQSQYIEFILDLCLIQNIQTELDSQKYDRQRILLQHDFFLEKLSFAIQILSLVQADCIQIVIDKLSQILEKSEQFLQSRDSHVRVRGLQILRLLGEACLMCQSDPLEISRQITQTIIPYLGSYSDPKITFYSLQLVDMIYRHLVPTDWDPQTRISQALEIWVCVQNQLESPWSNLRAITFSILCSWTQISLSELSSSTSNKLKSTLLPLLLTLLQSKDSQSRAGGLNLLGAFCGLSSTQPSMQTFRRHSQCIPIAIWELVFHLQDDWDTMIRDAAAVLIQLSAPRQAVRYFHQVQRQEFSLRFLTYEDDILSTDPDQAIFWVDQYSPQDILELVSIFKSDSKNPSQLWNQYTETKQEQLKQQFPVVSQQKLDEDFQTLEDLGVIDVDQEPTDQDQDIPVIKNSYNKRKNKIRPSAAVEDHNWALRPHNSSLRPHTPPAKSQPDQPKIDRPASRHQVRQEIEIIEEENTQLSPSTQMPQPPPSLQIFTVEQPVEVLGFEKLIQEQHSYPRIKEDQSRKSPRTPRRKIEQELASRLRNVPGPSTLSKIYLQKPDIGIIRKKSKSLNNSLLKQRKVSQRFSRTPVKKENKQ